MCSTGYNHLKLRTVVVKSDTAYSVGEACVQVLKLPLKHLKQRLPKVEPDDFTKLNGTKIM